MPSAALLLLILSTAATEDVVVMDLRGQSVALAKRRALTDLVVYGVSKRSRFRKVIGMDDVKAQLGRDALKQAINCDDTSCAAEIGAALGARNLLSMNANPLGGELILAITLIDTQTQASKRALAKVDVQNEKQWSKAVDDALDELFGATKPPPPPAQPGYTAPSPEQIKQQQLDMMVAAMKPRCKELDVQASIEGGPNLQKVIDQGLIAEYQWATTMNAMGYHWVVVAFCGPENLRAKAHATAGSIFSTIVEKAPDHSIRPSVDGYLELLRRNPVK